MKYLVVFLISMVPVIELRGGIPFGLSPAMGGALDLIPLYIVAIIGNMLPVPFIFFFERKILVWGSNRNWSKGFKWLLNKGEKLGQKITEKADASAYIALLLFVGIPLPGTGAWTGTLAASILDLDFKKSSIAVMLGVILAGIIMGFASASIFSLVF